MGEGACTCRRGSEPLAGPLELSVETVESAESVKGAGAGAVWVGSGMVAVAAPPGSWSASGLPAAATDSAGRPSPPEV